MYTADRSRLYWHTNKAWYRINRERDCYELTEEAPPEAIESFRLWEEGGQRKSMLTEKELEKIAKAEFVKEFGMEYIQENSANACMSRGIIGGTMYQLFVGFKGQSDLPERKANDHGWVEYGLVRVDANTGAIIYAEFAGYECPITGEPADVQFCFDACGVVEHWAPEYTAPKEARAVPGYKEICSSCVHHRKD